MIDFATLVQRVTFALVPGQMIEPEPLIRFGLRVGFEWWCGGSLLDAEALL